jgi:peroxiredoxin (alkyl hydroperoxide reductase subunit C)
MKSSVVIILTAVMLILLSGVVLGQAVLGPCGQPESSDTPAAPGGIRVSPVPLPGERAIDFELTAVVGDEIRKIKLSDYQGMYRVLCFYPADFTFV